MATPLGEDCTGTGCERICMWYGIRSYPRFCGWDICYRYRYRCCNPFFGQTSPAGRQCWAYSSVVLWMGLIFHSTGATPIQWYEHLVLGGFCFSALFTATDPVTSARTETGKWVYGFFIGAMAIIIRVLNPGYPEGMVACYPLWRMLPYSSTTV